MLVYYANCLLKTLSNFIAGHEHSTRDSRGQRLISINPVVTEPNCREPPKEESGVNE